MGTINLSALGGSRWIEMNRDIRYYLNRIDGTTVIRHSFINLSAILSNHSRDGIYVTKTEDLDYLPLYSVSAPNILPQYEQLYALPSTPHVSSAGGLIARQVNYTSAEASILSSINSTGQLNARANALAGASFVLRPSVLIDKPTKFLLGEVEGILTDVSTLSPYLFTYTQSYPWQGIYLDVFVTLSTLTRNILQPYRFKSGIFHVGGGIIVDFEDRRILAMTALTAKYLEYFMLKRNVEHGTNDMFMGIFTILVDEEFTKTNKKYPPKLFDVYNKGIVTPYVEAGMKMKSMDGQVLFEQLLGKPLLAERAVPLGPVEQIAENETLQASMFNDAKVKVKLQEENILICD